MTVSRILATVALAGAAVPALSQEFVQPGRDGVSLELYGQVNRALLFGDNGDQDDVFFVDNDNSATRFGIIGEYDTDVGLLVGSRIEFGLEQASSSSGVGPTFGDTEGEFDFQGRVFDVYFESDFGTFFLGQGSTASDGTQEADVSGTTVIGNVGVQDMAGSLTLNNSGERVRNLFNQLDGLGREGRVRYDSPSFNGVSFGISAASDARYDLAVKWSGEFDGGIEAEASAHYADLGDEDDIDFQYGGSASVGFQGFSATGALAFQEADDDRDPYYYYIKLGYDADLLTFGSTNFGVDYYYAEDISDDFDDGAGNLLGTEAQSFGVYVNQRISAAQTDLYAGYRLYDVDTPANDDDLNAFMIGARVRF